MNYKLRHKWRAIYGGTDYQNKDPNAAIGLNAAPPPTAQTSLRQIIGRRHEKPVGGINPLQQFYFYNFVTNLTRQFTL
jgi:hypothetical protein